MATRGLLPTKLHPRQARPQTIARPRLVAQLERCAALPLTLVLGPAGAGKSTAVVEWLEQTELAVAWLSLDPADDAPNRFLAYALAALQTVDDRLIHDAAALLAAPAPEDLEALWADLIVLPLAGRKDPLLLVLDDFHVIGDPRIHAALAWLLDHGPACLRLLLLSRSEPPLPLARARARGALGEIGVDDLRFSLAEARRFYAEVMGLQLDERTVAQLEQRIEGWPAGAQLAALSLRGRVSAELPSGRDRMIADYLLVEVLDALEPPLREFLLATALLERVCAPLGAAVTDDEQARERLVEIERANLFLIPLDAHGRWFRYHHLFRDFLRSRAGTRERAWQAAIHRRAALWLADRNHRAEAFEHAIASGDEALITELFERWAAETLVWSHTGAVREWLAKIPSSLREREGACWFMDGWCDVIVGQLDTGLAKLDRADEAHARGHASARVLPLILGLGPILRVAALLRAGRHDEAASLAVSARASLDPGQPAHALPYGSLLMHEALVDLERGQLDAAEPKLLRAESLLRVDKGLDVLTLAHLAELHRRKGRLDEAERCARRALQYAEESKTERLSLAGLARVELAWVAFERGRPEQALVELEQGLDRLKLLRDVAYLARGTELLARARASVGQREDAVELVDEALVLLEGTNMQPALARMVALRDELAHGISSGAIAIEPEPELELPPIDPLTAREAEVLSLVAAGLSNHAIGKRLCVSVGTVKTHVHRILSKLNVANRTHAVHRARLAGLIAKLVVGLGLLAGCRESISTSSVTPPEVARVNEPQCADGLAGHERARELVRCLDGEAALAAFEQLLRDDPGDALAGLGLAQTGLEFQRENQAGQALAAILEGDKTHAFGARVGQALLALAQYEQSHDTQAFRAAEIQLQNVLAVDPEHPQALALAVLLYLRRADMEVAATEGHAARIICEERQATHATLAASCAEEARRRGDPELARTLFAQATRADPDHHGAWMQRGILELEAGNLRSARRFLEQAILSPWPSIRVAAHIALGVALERLGDTPGAIAAYRLARDLCIRTNHAVPPDLLYNLGLAASRSVADEADIAEAREALLQYLRTATPSEAQRLRIEQALRQLDSIAAEQERAQR